MSVLIDTDIESNFNRIFRSGADTSNIRSAKYYLTLGDAFPTRLIGSNSRGQSRGRNVTLKPGQSVVVSTKERLSMPIDLMGIIGARFESSMTGLLFFGGMIVDPGFGMHTEVSGEVVGEPLVMTIANVGDLTVQLRPGDPLISIVFLDLGKPVSERMLGAHEPAQPALERERELKEGTWRGSAHAARPLGVVDELKQVTEKVDKVSTSTEQVILFGVIVLSVTLCAAVISAVFATHDHFKINESIARSVGLTLGTAVAAIFLFTGAFYVGVRVVAGWTGVRRKVQLNRDEG